ncbi:MAG: helix-turn-helix domain-containing protein [Candidatus Dormibacteraeota bacterium]|nr:helix-turn-helix domain-containing protein [Candidatus Dormibacteraeota bacterium]
MYEAAFRHPDAHRSAAPESARANEWSSTALLSVRDVCRLLQCGRTFVFELMHNGELRPIKLGRLTRFTRAELDAFLAARVAEAAGSPGGEARIANDPAGRPNHRGVADREHPRGVVRRSSGTAASAMAMDQPCLLDPDTSASVRR